MTTEYVDLLLEDFIREVEVKVGELGEKRRSRVSRHHWFLASFGKDRAEVFQEMQDDPGRSHMYKMPLLNIYRMDEMVFNMEKCLEKKLLLRDDENYVEYPPIVRVNWVAEKEVTPDGFEINQDAKQSGFYMYDAQVGRESKKFMIHATFDLGDGEQVSREFQLDFLLSCIPYADAVQTAYEIHVLQPLRQAIFKRLGEVRGRMHHTLARLYQESGGSLTGTNTRMLWSYLPNMSKYE